MSVTFSHTRFELDLSCACANMNVTPHKETNMSHTIATLGDIFPLLGGYGGTVFRVIDAETVVTGDDSDDLLNLYRSAQPFPGSSHVHDDEHVSVKLGAGWTVVAHLYTESTGAHYRHQKVVDAAKLALSTPGVYAVETVLDGDEYAELSTYLLRYEGGA